MREPLSEHFQITAPAKEEAGEPWVSFESVRKPRLVTRGMLDLPSKQGGSLPVSRLNLIPSTEILEPTQSWSNLDRAGSTDVTDNVNDVDIIRGWDRHLIKPQDDQYHGEHVDLFYGTVVGTDDADNKVTGFIERNNYLDRL